jgi:hypothetical protein
VQPVREPEIVLPSSGSDSTDIPLLDVRYYEAMEKL